MPPFSITVSGDSLNNLAENVLLIAEQFKTTNGSRADTAPAGDVAAAPKAAPRARKAPEAAPAPAAAPVAAPAAVQGVTKDAVVKKLILLINANDAIKPSSGKQVCTDLCLKFGGKNASTIDPSRYAELIKSVDEALTALSEDPTA